MSGILNSLDDCVKGNVTNIDGVKFQAILAQRSPDKL